MKSRRSEGVGVASIRAERGARAWIGRRAFGVTVRLALAVFAAGGARGAGPGVGPALSEPTFAVVKSFGGVAIGSANLVLGSDGALYGVSVQGNGSVEG